jgi:hypothetical protein
LNVTVIERGELYSLEQAKVLPGKQPQTRLGTGVKQGRRCAERTTMNRERALTVVLAIAGVLFIALAYPLVLFLRQEPALSMMFSVYVTLGVFLLLAVREPSANRGLIAFTAWSSLAHAAVMGTQAMLNMISRGELIGVAVLIAIGIALIALAPPRQTKERTSLDWSGRGADSKVAP